jgi:hypothetical protein
MDRVTVYQGQIPLETDILHTGQNTMVALAKLCAGVLGTPTIANNFQCTPTVPATLNVIITPGEIYQIENLEVSNWSSLPADVAHSIVKQGILQDPVTLGITPPVTFGFSQVYLIQFAYLDVDTGLTILPYFNAANPSQPFMGPGNDGFAQNTVRQGQVAIQTKAGIAAATGTQVAPSPDPGFLGLFTVTVANGQSTITSGNIAILPQTTINPLFIPVTLPQVPTGVQSGKWEYAQDTSVTANQIIARGFNPPVISLTVGQTARVKIANANTGATTMDVGTGFNPVRRANLSALQSGDINPNMIVEMVWDGTQWQIVNYFGFTSTTTNNNTFTLTVPYCVDTSVTANQVTAPFSPALTDYTTNRLILVKIANANTGASVINPNGLGNVAITRPDQTPLQAGDMVVGMVAELTFDGTEYQLVNGAKGYSTQIWNITSTNVLGVGAVWVSTGPALSAMSVNLGNSTGTWSVLCPASGTYGTGGVGTKVTSMTQAQSQTGWNNYMSFPAFVSSYILNAPPTPIVLPGPGTWICTTDIQSVPGISGPMAPQREYFGGSTLAATFGATPPNYTGVLQTEAATQGQNPGSTWSDIGGTFSTAGNASVTGLWTYIRIA